MKIKISKTLLEPVGIPWFIISDNDLVMQIIVAVHEFFHEAVRLNTIPTNNWEEWGKSQFSVAEIVDCLTIIATEAGAETVSATVSSEIDCNKDKVIVVGYSYHIGFTVPHDPHSYATTIDHWFDPERPTRYGRR